MRTTDLAWSPEGRWLALGNQDVIRLVDTTGAEESRKIGPFGGLPAAVIDWVTQCDDCPSAPARLGAYAADTTALNHAKFGLLYLRDGIRDGERILPEGWVEYSRTPSATDPIYGSGWWLDPERPAVFYAVGVDGQVITVDPEHDLTFVTLATDGPVSLPVSETILDAFAAGVQERPRGLPGQAAGAFAAAG